MNIKRIISSQVVQAFLIYISSGWIILEMTDYFISNYDLTARFRDILLIIMIIGLPITLFLTWMVSREKPKEEEKGIGVFKSLLKRPWFSIPGMVVIVLLIFTSVRYIYRHSSEEAAYSNLAASMHQQEVTMAILPFTSITGNPDQEWLVSRQHDILQHELSLISQVRPLRIISLNVGNLIKKYEKSIEEIATEIDVEYLVEAAVLGSADSVTLQLQLIHLNPEREVVWAETSGSGFSHILGFYGDLSQRIAQKINLGLSPAEEERFRSSREINPESYKAYLRGMYHLNMLTPEGMETGLEYFHEAVRLDPAEPYAHAGLALAYLEIAHSPLDPGDALPKAEAAAEKAFTLDTTLAQVYTALGEVNMYQLWNFELAEHNFKKALAINPNLAIVHYHYAWTLYMLGDLEGAIREHLLAQKYDPFNPLHYAWMGMLYCANDEIDKAIEVAQEALEFNENYVASYFVMGLAHLQAGRIEEAIEVLQKLRELSARWSWALGYAYAVAGQTENAQEILNEIENGRINGFIAWGLVWLNTALGRMDEAINWLNYEHPHAFHAWTAVQGELEPLREDPRYEEFRKKITLPG